MWERRGKTGGGKPRMLSFKTKWEGIKVGTRVATYESDIAYFHFPQPGDCFTPILAGFHASGL